MSFFGAVNQRDGGGVSEDDAALVDGAGRVGSQGTRGSTAPCVERAVTHS